MSHENNAQCTGERGSAMIMAVFVLTLVAGMGSALLFLSHTEVTMATSSLDIKKAFYLAEAGEEDGRTTLFIANGVGEEFSDDLADGTGGGTAGPNGVIDFDRTTIAPIYDGDGNVTGFTGYDDDIPITAATPLGGGPNLPRRRSPGSDCRQSRWTLAGGACLRQLWRWIDAAVQGRICTEADFRRFNRLEHVSTHIWP